MNSQENPTPSPNGYQRWTCPHHENPVLLAMVDDEGHLQIKVRDRVWTVDGFRTVTATCPKCGKVHTHRFFADGGVLRAPESLCSRKGVRT